MDGPELKRSISLLMLVLYGLGVTIGAGIYQPVDEVGSGRWLTGLIHCRRGLWEIGDGDGSAG